MTNYDRIRNMSVEEMANFLLDIGFDYEYGDYVTGSNERYADYDYEKALAEEIKWLESEVESESDRDRLIEILKVPIFPHLDVEPAEVVADYLLENGVIVPPCKVGQTVYYISFGKVYKGKCHAITLNPTMQIHLYDYDGDNVSISASKVFLTKEEAEEKLKEFGNEWFY